MTSAARADAEITAPATAMTRHLAQTTGELERLRASLDAKLAELETALENPDGCDSLERLVIELARVATREADAAATRTCVEAQVAAQEQVSRARVEADNAVQTERDGAEALQSQLDAARATLDGERAAAATLNAKVDELQASLQAERATGRVLRQAAEQAEQRTVFVETAKSRELAELRDQFDLEHASARAEVAQLEQTLEALRLEHAAVREASDQQRGALEAAERATDVAEQRAAESERERREAEIRAEAARTEAATLAGDLRAARDAADKERADLEASQRGVEASEQRAAESERERREAEIRAEAARTEAAALTDSLRLAREAGEERIAAMQARLDAAERQAAEQVRQHHDAAEAVADAAHRERAALTAELESAREAARAASELRPQLEAVDTERANIERALKDTECSLEATLRERDRVSAELEAARDATAAAIAAAEERYEELRGSAALRIRELEREVLEARSVSAASASLDTADEIEHDLGEELFTDEPDVIDIGAAAPAAEPAGLIAPTRRTERHLISDEVEVQVDDAPAMLVDLSVNGAQILSLTALKPNRAVAFVLPVGGRAVLCKGKIVWARLEASSDVLKYRGGIFFTHVDQGAIKAFLAGEPYQPKATQPSSEMKAGQSLSADADTERHTTPPTAAVSAR